MKLLIADLVYPYGHLNLNNHLLDILSGIDYIDSLKVLNYKNYYSKNNNGIKLYKLHYLLYSKNVILRYFTPFINALLVSFRCLFIKYDKVIFFTFDTLSFYIVTLFIKKPIYLFHHNNTDQLNDPKKNFLFRLYSNRVNHIVFDGYIKDYLLSKNVHDNLIHVLPHPLPIHSFKTSCILGDDLRKFIGLGHENDSTLISDIVNYELHNHVLEKNNIKLVLRVKYNFDFDVPKSITIISDYLSREDYEQLYHSAFGVLVLFKESYRYRYSGTIVDALDLKKVVVGRDIPVVRSFSKLYPKSCFVFYTIDDFFNKIISCSKVPDYEHNIFQLNHSDYKIRRKFYEILY